MRVTRTHTLPALLLGMDRWRASPPYYYHLLPRTCFLLRSSNTSPSFPHLPFPVTRRAISRLLWGLLLHFFSFLPPTLPFARALHNRVSFYGALIKMHIDVRETTHIIHNPGKERSRGGRERERDKKILGSDDWKKFKRYLSGNILTFVLRTLCVRLINWDLYM